MTPKVLVACPSAHAKDYCFKEWLNCAMNLTYPAYDIKIFDNTQDYGINTAYQNTHFKNKYGKHNKKFECINTMALHKLQTNAITSLIERTTLSHNDCRDACIQGGYDYLLHLESDVMPPKDVIEQLMYHNKKVVGALFYRDNGISRQPMIQTIHQMHNKGYIILNAMPQDDILFDGALQKVYSVGLGCILIKREVLEKIKFRHTPGVNLHADSYFSEDCHKNKIDIFIDPNVVCRHENMPWGLWGIDIN